MNTNFLSIKDSTKAFFAGGAKRYQKGGYESILEKVNVSLVVFDSFIINTHSGEYRELSSSSDVNELAELADEIVANRQNSAGVLLVLPDSWFVSTSFDLAVRNGDMLRSALQLQAHTLIPAYGGELLLGVNSSSSKGLALWFSASKADLLFRAFNQKGLFLAGIMPRSLALIKSSIDGEAIEAANTRGVVIHDNDSTHCTQLYFKEGCIKSHLSVSRADLKQNCFANQWQDETQGLTGADKWMLSSLNDWLKRKMLISAVEDYCFFPGGAIDSVQKSSLSRSRQWFGGVGVAAMLLICIPFLVNWWAIINLEDELVESRQLATESIEIENSIRELNATWGAITDFPEMELIEVLLSLNSIETIRSSLISLSVDKGIVDITGSTTDPGALVEALSERENFYDITQSRSISGVNNGSGANRFGIQLNLSGVDFDAYARQHPIINDNTN